METFVDADHEPAALRLLTDRRYVVGRTRRRLAAEHLAELVTIHKRIETATSELRELIGATGSSLKELAGIGPSGAARLHRRRNAGCQVTDPVGRRPRRRHHRPRDTWRAPLGARKAPKR